MSLPWLSDPRRPMVSPRELPKLEAWFDALDTRTMLAGDGTTITDGGAVALWADKSGNSGVNAFVSAAGAGNYISFTALTAAGTGAFTVSAKVRPASLGAYAIFGSANNGFGLLITAGGTIQSSLRGVADNTASTGTIAALTEYVITYVRSGTTGTYYINGAASGTTTDSRNYSAGVSLLGASDSVIGAFLPGAIKWARVYSSALDASAVAADAAGTVQANNVFNCDFSTTTKKLANGDTFTCSTGQTVTLNSSGATGARIAGERDLFQGTAANRPIYLGYSGTKYAYFAGIAGFTVSVPLANDTYDVGITYKDGTTDTSTVVVGAGVAAFGGTDAKFAGKMVTRIVVSKSSVTQATFTPSLYTSGTSFTSSDTLTWTLNGGATIVTRSGLYFNGSSHYLKSPAFSLSQPESAYFVGSHLVWTDARTFFDGNASTSMQLRQRSSTPQLALNAGSLVFANGNLPLQTAGVVSAIFNGASSSLRVNRTTASTGDAGSTAAGGITLGANGAASGGSYGNLMVSELPIYAAAHNTATEERVKLYEGRKWGFAV